jgi:hypothetical protein
MTKNLNDGNVNNFADKCQHPYRLLQRGLHIFRHIPYGNHLEMSPLQGIWHPITPSFRESLKPHLTGHAMRTTTIVITKLATCVRTPAVKINGCVAVVFLLWKVPIITCSSSLNATSFPSYQMHISCVTSFKTTWLGSQPPSRISKKIRYKCCYFCFINDKIRTPNYIEYCGRTVGIRASNSVDPTSDSQYEVLPSWLRS